MANKMWLGPTISSGDHEFQVPDSSPINAAGWRVDDEATKKAVYTIQTVKAKKKGESNSALRYWA